MGANAITHSGSDRDDSSSPETMDVPGGQQKKEFYLKYLYMEINMY